MKTVVARRSPVAVTIDPSCEVVPLGVRARGTSLLCDACGGAVPLRGGLLFVCFPHPYRSNHGLRTFRLKCNDCIHVEVAHAPAHPDIIVLRCMTMPRSWVL